MVKNNETLLSFMSNLQTHYNIKLDFQKINQHAGGKWLILGIKHPKDNTGKDLNSPVEYTGRESRHVTKESECSMIIPIVKERSRRRNIQKGCRTKTV